MSIILFLLAMLISITPSKTNTVVRIIDHKLLYKNYLSAVCVYAAAEKFSSIAGYMTSLDIVLVLLCVKQYWGQLLLIIMHKI